ncbi:MAG: hypothetical protein B7Z77_07485, partial [Acidocella sp. 20-58-15]
GEFLAGMAKVKPGLAGGGGYRNVPPAFFSSQGEGSAYQLQVEFITHGMNVGTGGLVANDFKLKPCG